MLTSKCKNSCAYIKPSNNKHKTTNNKSITPEPTPHSSQKQNIYDSLLGALQQQDSSYIIKLLQKQQRKSNKNQQNNHKQTNPHMLAQTTNHSHTPIDKNKGQKTNRSVKKSKLCSPRYMQQNKQIKIEQDYPQEQSKLRKYLSSDCLPCMQKIKCTNNFIDNITHYLSQIKQNVVEGRSKVQQERQFRKTIQLGQRKLQQFPEGQVSIKKYKNVLNQLQRVVKINDLLQQRVQSQQEQMDHMKKIIRNMFYEINYLKEQLHEEQHQKAKYSQVFHQFSAEISKLKSKSNQKRRHSHKKRNSYIPHSSSSVFQSEHQSNNKNKYKQLMESNKKIDLSYLYRQNDSTPLKKRGKLHKYKISDGCLNFLQEQSQSTASIYKERYH